jgi:S-adenosylmethionine synthetase
MNMAEKNTYLFSSESVSEGHPDKICDQISDAVLDVCITDDPASRVACETYTSTGMVLVGGEITTETYVSLQELIRGVVRGIGYDNPEYGLDYQSMAILNTINQQSPDISQGVEIGKGLHKEQGAGDQGMMFGYACDDTPEFMPAPIMLSHKIMMQAARLRKDETIPWMRPDGKCQVTIAYEDHIPDYVQTVVVSQQHDPDVSYDEIEKTVIEQIVRPVLEESGLMKQDVVYHINPTGRFVVGGPQGDSGLTGRKIIVDTYGGMGRHGGGAFSGKDPSKVDRSGAYMARYVAKNLAAAGICRRCEIQIAYAIGVAEPVSIMADTFGTGVISDREIERIIRKEFDLTPAGIIRNLDLLKPIYHKTAAYGHFGRDSFSWEQTDRIGDLQRYI